jgi:malonyl-CoA O-methyltransferase
MDELDSESSGTNRVIETAASVRDGYDRWSAVYDHDANPLQALEEPLLRAAIGDVNGCTALDLGCGTGRHALWLAANGAIVTAVDFSEGMMAEARRKPGAERIEFIAHDLHQPLPLADGSFDLVVSGLVLEHLQELGGFFAEARRVLKPGGRAVVSSMHPAYSKPHTIGDFVMAAVRAGFRLSDIGEYAPDAEFAKGFPRAGK